MDRAGAHLDSLAAGGQLADCAPTVQAAEAIMTESHSSDLDLRKGAEIGSPSQSQDSSTSSSETPTEANLANGVAVREVRPPQPNLSNMLNPNNIYYDHRLACSYKRMSKVERDELWALDAAMRQAAPGSGLVSNGTSNTGGCTFVTVPTDTSSAMHSVTLPSHTLPSAAVTSAYQNASMHFIASQQQQQLATVVLDGQPGLRQVLLMPGVQQQRLVPNTYAGGTAVSGQAGVYVDATQPAMYVTGSDGTLYAAPVGQAEGLFASNATVGFCGNGAQSIAVPGTLSQDVVHQQALTGTLVDSSNAGLLQALAGINHTTATGTAVDDLTLSLDGLTCEENHHLPPHMATDSLHTWAVVTQQLSALLPPDALPSSVTELMAQLINQGPQQQLLAQQAALHMNGQGALPQAEPPQQLPVQATKPPTSGQLGALQLGKGPCSSQLTSEASTPAQHQTGALTALLRQNGPSPAPQAVGLPTQTQGFGPATAQTQTFGHSSSFGSTHAPSVGGAQAQTDGGAQGQPAPFMVHPALGDDVTSQLLTSSSQQHVITSSSLVSDIGPVEAVQCAARASDSMGLGSLPQTRQHVQPQSERWQMLTARMQQLKGASSAPQSDDGLVPQNAVVGTATTEQQQLPLQTMDVMNHADQGHLAADSVHMDSHMPAVGQQQNLAQSLMQQQDAAQSLLQQQDLPHTLLQQQNMTALQQQQSMAQVTLQNQNMLQAPLHSQNMSGSALQQQQILDRLQQLQALCKSGQLSAQAVPTLPTANQQQANGCVPTDLLGLSQSDSFAQDITQSLLCRPSGQLGTNDMLLQTRVQSLSMSGPMAGSSVVNLPSAHLQAKAVGSGARMLVTQNSMPQQQRQVFLHSQQQQAAAILTERVQKLAQPQPGQLFLQPTPQQQQQQANVQWVQVPGGFVPVLQGSAPATTLQHNILHTQSLGGVASQPRQQLLLPPQQTRAQTVGQRADGTWVVGSLSEPVWYQ